MNSRLLENYGTKYNVIDINVCSSVAIISSVVGSPLSPGVQASPASPGQTVAAGEFGTRIYRDASEYIKSKYIDYLNILQENNNTKLRLCEIYEIVQSDFL